MIEPFLTSLATPVADCDFQSVALVNEECVEWRPITCVARDNSGLGPQRRWKDPSRVGPCIVELTALIASCINIVTRVDRKRW